MSALGLADYGSSDDEEEVVAPAVSEVADTGVKEAGLVSSRVAERDAVVQSKSKIDQTTHAGPTLGPAPGPTATLPNMGDETTVLLDDSIGQSPSSPYTASRQLMRNLTMPPVPNFEIPPSPPGSPPSGTTAKFTRFLELKTKGVHFNERLHQSSALRNPGLLSKLMEFAGISEEDQYASALPKTLAVPTKFPEWAYADRLIKEHERIAKRKEDERTRMQREAVEFVPAKATDHDSRPSPGPPGAGKPEEKSPGRSERPEAKRSRFDDPGRAETKRSRFDERNRGAPKRGR